MHERFRRRRGPTRPAAPRFRSPVDAYQSGGFAEAGADLMEQGEHPPGRAWLAVGRTAARTALGAAAAIPSARGRRVARRPRRSCFSAEAARRSPPRQRSPAGAAPSGCSRPGQSLAYGARRAGASGGVRGGGDGRSQRSGRALLGRGAHSPDETPRARRPCAVAGTPYGRAANRRLVVGALASASPGGRRERDHYRRLGDSRRSAHTAWLRRRGRPSGLWRYDA